jgi:hypothetical protein
LKGSKHWFLAPGSWGKAIVPIMIGKDWAMAMKQTAQETG